MSETASNAEERRPLFRPEQPLEPPRALKLQSDEIDQVVAALAKAQGQFRNPERNRLVTVQKRAGGQYSWTYADLAGIMDMIRKPLDDNELALVQRTISRGRELWTMVAHSSGQYLSTTVPLLIHDSMSNQEYGSTTTYQRRYQIQLLLGIAAETDDDANAADGNTTQDRKPIPMQPNAMKEPELPRVKPAVSFEAEGTAKSFRAKVEAAAKASNFDELDSLQIMYQDELKLVKMQNPKAFQELEQAIGGTYPSGLILEVKDDL